MIDLGSRIPFHRPRDLAASIGVEPISLGLEGPGPYSLGEAKLERTTRIELAYASLATTLITLTASAYLVGHKGIEPAHYRFAGGSITSLPSRDTVG